MRFGVREIANVTFRPLAPLDIGKQHFSANQPCLYIDTATASNMEVATTTVYAQGGRGNARLIAWEGEKTATFTVTDALLSPISFAMLSGAGVIDEVAGSKIVHLTVDGIIDSTGTKIVIDKADIAGYKLVASGASSGDGAGLNLYGMVLDNNGNIVDYLGELEIEQPEEEKNDQANWEIDLSDTTNTYKDYSCRIDCYAKVDAPVTTLEVDAENFGGTFYIEAETLFRDEATGRDFPATFIIPKGKIQGNFTFNMAASGDPSTFDFTIDCTLGTVRTAKNKNKKMLYAIDIIDNVSEGGHVDTQGTVDAPEIDGVTGTGSIFGANATAKTRLTTYNTKVTATAADGVTQVKSLEGEDKVLTLNTDYTVTYTGDEGAYTGYTITFKGDYIGSITGTITS